ncbi:MAG TPA: hypothetical protein VG755_08045 [Nannocystaceae bacterium]|nr:hypothetical protein [Nannocystaceae bacterium]
MAACEDPTSLAWAQSAGGPSSERVGGADFDDAGSIDQTLVDELRARGSGIGMVGRFGTMIDLGPALAAEAELDVMVARFE